MPDDRRFPRSVYGRGSEPDPRFSLANERTFLAWIRTSLALVAAGVALEALPLPVHAVPRIVAAALFVLLGLGAAGQAWLGWLRAETALRENRALPGPVLAPVLAVGVAVGTLVLVAGLLVP
ncbi:hypothetical protein BJF78_36280 [Pseudonocardia sp. CNS-139]|nr:hypothetical protein BJF78_36280 [Pseudonocardia sp. CNS-139]